MTGEKLTFFFLKNIFWLYLYSDTFIKLKRSIRHLTSLLKLHFPSISAVLMLFVSISLITKPQSLNSKCAKGAVYVARAEIQQPYVLLQNKLGLAHAHQGCSPVVVR